jgi:tRNA 2-thiouridine synthesizing protein B
MKKTILHTVNKSPFTHQTLKDCLDISNNDDAVVLLEDGVYAALDSQPQNKLLSNNRCFVLEEDLQARGLTTQKLLQNIEHITYERFVQLCAEYDMVQSWY